MLNMKLGVCPCDPVTSGFFCSHNKGVLYYQRLLENAHGRCAVEGTRCAEEMQAYRKACDMGTVEDIFSYLNSIAHERLQHDVMDDNPSEIIYFETGEDQLKTTCNNDSGRSSSFYARLLGRRP